MTALKPALEYRQDGFGVKANWASDKKSEQMPVLTLEQAQKMYSELGLEMQYRPLLEEIRYCAANDSFFFGPMWGKNRRGKSSLALWLLYYIYGDWETALNYLVFTLPDLLELIYQALRERKSIPLVVWDDMGVHAGKRTKSVTAVFKSFSEMFDAIGTVLHGLIGTCILPNSTVPALRERYLGEVLVEPRGHYNFMSYDWRIAYYLPGQPYFCKVWCEEGNFYGVPPEVYSKYSPERDRLLAMKFAEVYENTYTLSSTAVKIDDVQRATLLKILSKKDGTPMRDDHLRDHLFSLGYDTPSVAMTLAKLESQQLSVKRGQMWLVTPRGKQALESKTTGEP